MHRKKFRSLEAVSEAFLGYVTRAQDFNIAVGRYVIMPDHLHFFVGGGRDFVLSTWIKGLKRTIANACALERGQALWQPGFFDHLIRSHESYSEKWSYVRQNPVRAGLASHADEWPYAGEVVFIDRM